MIYSCTLIISFCNNHDSWFTFFVIDPTLDRKQRERGGDIVALLSDAAGCPESWQKGRKEGKSESESATVTFAQQRVHLLLFQDEDAARCYSLLFFMQRKLIETHQFVFSLSLPIRGWLLLLRFCHVLFSPIDIWRGLLRPRRKSGCWMAFFSW